MTRYFLKKHNNEKVLELTLCQNKDLEKNKNAYSIYAFDFAKNSNLINLFQMINFGTVEKNINYLALFCVNAYGAFETVEEAKKFLSKNPLLLIYCGTTELKKLVKKEIYKNEFNPKLTIIFGDNSTLKFSDSGITKENAGDVSLLLISKNKLTDVAAYSFEYNNPIRYDNFRWISYRSVLKYFKAEHKLPLMAIHDFNLKQLYLSKFEISNELTVFELTNRVREVVKKVCLEINKNFPGLYTSNAFLFQVIEEIRLPKMKLLPQDIILLVDEFAEIARFYHDTLGNIAFGHDANFIKELVNCNFNK